MPGKYFEDLSIGQHFHHQTGRTVTETDNVLFSSLTMNSQPLHLNEDFAAKSQYGKRIVNGLFTLALVVGLSVHDLTEGTIVANLGYSDINHPNPLFPGETIYVETEVIGKRESKSRNNCGIIRLKQWGKKPDGTIVVELERTVLFLKRPQADQPQGE